ncbi:MAG TPA: hypothetical protein VK233_00505, partial [Candidatus Dormibacteraeota bacterium]|nr:hypothetical protein [Candidatus Dormibacteraeota bacterium]
MIATGSGGAGVVVTPAAADGAVSAAAVPPAPAPFAFPIMLEVRGRRAVIAGGGREPADKAGSLAAL